MEATCNYLYQKGFLNNSFSDITISVLGMEYRLHRLILAQNSYFAAMLEREWKESAQPRIELALDEPHISVESMTLLFAR